MPARRQNVSSSIEGRTRICSGRRTEPRSRSFQREPTTASSLFYRNDETPIEFVAPTTSQDIMPRWSPDGEKGSRWLAAWRRRGVAKSVNWNPVPWEIWVGDVRAGSGGQVWSSTNTTRGSLPQTAGGPFLQWVAGDRLIFKSEQDNWGHLYAVSASSGAERLLTPGTSWSKTLTSRRIGSQSSTRRTPARHRATTTAATRSASTSTPARPRSSCRAPAAKRSPSRLPAARTHSTALPRSSR